VAIVNHGLRLRFRFAAASARSDRLVKIYKKGKL